MPELHASVSRERMQAAEIIRRYARSPLDLMKLWPPKFYAFSASGRAVIAYQVACNVAISLGDPVGPEAEIESNARRFAQLCAQKRWALAFYRTTPEFLPVCDRLQLRKLKIGDDAIVDLSEFSLRGKSKRDIRSKARQFEQSGIQVVNYQPPLSATTIAKLRAVSDEWLRIPGRRERTFTVGYFDSDYLRSTPVLAVVDPAGTILAFMNLISVNTTEITGDLVRRRAATPNGITDYLFLNFLKYAREREYRRVNLGLAPMTGSKGTECATMEERVIHGLFQKLNTVFRFRGLSRYKAKFVTSWEPRYLIYRNLFDLFRIALALRRVSELKQNREESWGPRQSPVGWR